MIYKDNAPRYFEKGLPVIPLRGKAPIIQKWQRFHDTMPTPEEQKAMLENYADYNMGLPLGKQSGCIALDIDSEIDAEVKLIDALVPTSPWVRVGRKGKVLMFKYNGEQTFRIKDATGRTICELLSSKVQVVLPPSIHPETKKPYVANCELLDVLDQLPVLPKDIEETLRNAFVDKLGVKLSSKGYSKTIDFVSKGSRDVKMTSVAGIYANAVLRGEMTLKEAVDVFRAWCFTQTEKVVGDDVDVEKGVRNLVRFLMRNVEGKGRPLPKGWDEGLDQEEKESLGVVVNEDIAVSWDFAKVRSYLKIKLEELGNPDEHPQEVDELIEFVLEQIARSTTMSSLDIDRAFKHIAGLSGDVKIPALRKRLVELQSAGISGTNHTEIAIAVLKDLNDSVDAGIRGNGNQEDYDNVRFVGSNFWIWGGSNWEKLDDRDILQRISQDYGAYKAAAKASDHKGILQVMKTLVRNQLGDEGAGNGINFANGFVDTLGTIHPHGKQWGCTYTMPFCYKPELAEGVTEKGMFNEFLNTIWGQDEDFEDKVRLLRQVMGATMFGLGPSFQRAVLLFGIGQSGKTQLLRIVEGLLPDTAVSYISPYDFGDKFKPAELANSLMNVCGELSASGFIPSEQFKQVVDGTIMQGQLKGQQVFNFKPRAMHWFASNHLPHSKDTTEGFNRRWAILTFNHMVPKEKKVRDVGDKIVAAEREAICAWVVAGMKELETAGDFTLPKSHFERIGDMCAENDSLFFYLVSDKGPKKKEGETIELERLYAGYKAFCYSEAGAKPIGLRKFYTRMKELGIVMGFTIEGAGTLAKGLTLDGSGETLGR